MQAAHLEWLLWLYFKMTPLMSAFHKLYLQKPDLEILQLPLVYYTNRAFKINCYKSYKQLTGERTTRCHPMVSANSIASRNPHLEVR